MHQAKNANRKSCIVNRESHMPRGMSLILFAALLTLAFLVLTDAVRTSFVKLGVPREMVTAIMLGSILGSIINIPVWERSAGFAGGQVMRIGRYLYYQPPRIQRQIVAVNVGGALIPAFISVWLLHDAPLIKIVAATVVVAAVARSTARVVPGKGIQMPLLVAPVAAVLVATFLTLSGGTRIEAAPLAYISGSMGTLIGADLLNLRRLEQMGPGVMSIGGAGVFDGVFLVGLLAAFIA